MNSYYWKKDSVLNTLIYFLLIWRKKKIKIFNTKSSFTAAAAGVRCMQESVMCNIQWTALFTVYRCNTFLFSAHHHNVVVWKDTIGNKAICLVDRDELRRVQTHVQTCLNSPAGKPSKPSANPRRRRHSPPCSHTYARGMLQGRECPRHPWLATGPDSFPAEELRQTRTCAWTYLNSLLLVEDWIHWIATHMDTTPF